MKYISSFFINQLVSSIDLMDIVSDKINLIKTGKYYKSYCPFHNESNPSFIINEEKKFFYCFGCKYYGNIIDFLMKFDNLGFIDVVKKLSKFSGLSIPINDYGIKKNINITKNKYYLNLLLNLNKIYIDSLFLEINSSLLKDFLFNRNISLNSLRYFNIGYSSKKIVDKYIYCLKSKDRFNLIKLGLLVKGDNGKIYDRLYNRITFPIYDLRGNIIAFGGRNLLKKNYVKYINTSNNILFCKKFCLYNLYNLIRKNKKIEKILIVEGYIDVIMLSQFGIDYTVALLGSNITFNQIKILFFYTDNIFFCFDGDKSGEFLIKKTLELISSNVKNNKKYFFVMLPYGEDPDSLIRKEGKNKFENRIDNALSFIDLLFKYASLGKKLNTIEGKISYLKSLSPYISNIKSPIINFFLKNKINNDIGVLDNSNDLNKFLLVNNFKKNKVKFTILRCLISLVLKYPFLSKKVNLSDKLYKINFDIPGLFLFLDIVVFCLKKKNISVIDIIGNFKDKNIKIYLKTLYLWDYFSYDTDYNLIFEDVLFKLKFFIIEKKLRRMVKLDCLYGLSERKKNEIWKLIKFKNFVS